MEEVEEMMLIRVGQKTCGNCKDQLLKADIYANPNINPRKEGNPWHCPKCKQRYVSFDVSYFEHIEMMQEELRSRTE